jgi:hypothetical protein
MGEPPVGWRSMRPGQEGPILSSNSGLSNEKLVTVLFSRQRRDEMQEIQDERPGFKQGSQKFGLSRGHREVVTKLSKFMAKPGRSDFESYNLAYILRC